MTEARVPMRGTGIGAARSRVESSVMGRGAKGLQDCVLSPVPAMRLLEEQPLLTFRSGRTMSDQQERRRRTSRRAVHFDAVGTNNVDEALGPADIGASVAAVRCWRYAWVLDLDIQNILRSHRHKPADACGPQTHGLSVVCFSTSKRWLKAPVQMADGKRPRCAGKRRRHRAGLSAQSCRISFSCITRSDIWMSAEPSDHSVRAVCRRCDLPLS